MAKSRKSSWLIIIILLIAAGAGGGYYYWQSSNEKPPDISTTTVTRGSIIQSITATGILQAPTSVDVSSQISGKVIERRVDYNDRVREGDVLCLIDPATYQSKVLQTEAQLANTKASTTLTRLNTERTRELFQKKLVSQADLDQAEAQLAQADAQLKIQEANVETARLDLERCTITAPITGIVLDRQTDVGKTVAASLNAPTLFTLITDLTKMEISADVSEADIGNIAVDQEVQFTVDAFPGRQFQGKVTQIRNLPKTQQSVVVYGTIISVDNRDLRLKPGMTANVSIITARRDNVLKIANSTLRVRIPDKLMPPSPVKTDAAPATDGQPKREHTAKSGGGEGGGRRGQFGALMQEVGITRGQPATPDQVEKLKALAAERNMQIPEQMLAMLSGNRPSNTAAVTTRTLYRVTSPYPGLTLEAIPVRCGISDGTSTEIISGIEENESVISSIYLSGASTTPGGNNNNPFGGNRGFGGGFR